MRTIGLMSGTSLDGVDGILCQWQDNTDQDTGLSQFAMPSVLAFVHQDFDPQLRNELFALQTSGINELERAALAANGVAMAYARVSQALLKQAGLQPSDIRATGAHGQTVRHKPPTSPQDPVENAYTIQLLNAALLSEQTQIATVHDLRSRDIAAGGQGAPLVPALHASLFAKKNHTQIVCNIGGIANISILHADGSVTGFDTGPGNCLMDYWATQHLGSSFDKDGKFAASGFIYEPLKAKMLQDPYFTRGIPKSTGRDLFNPEWLSALIEEFEALAPADVQASLCELTAQSISNAIKQHAPKAQQVWVCGGGAFNHTLMDRLEKLTGLPCAATSVCGIPEMQVEALAFAWLARAYVLGKAANLPSVTGAKGLRILGSYTPA